MEPTNRKADDPAIETMLRTREFLRIGNEGVFAAQERNRQLGVPNVYSINGFIYYELPNGELSRQDPYTGDRDAAQASASPIDENSGK